MSMKTTNDYVALKERVIALKAVSEKDRKTIEYNISKFKNIIANISDSSKLRVSEAGIDITILDNIDYDKLRVDREYMLYVKKNLEMIISKCTSIVEAALND